MAQALLAAARRLAEESGAVGLELVTARTNLAAQRLYQSLGWRHDDGFLRYELSLDEWTVEIAGNTYPARVSLRPMYDPRNERIRM